MIGNRWLQQKYAHFFKNYMFCKICVAESQISRFMCSAVQNPRFCFSEFTENACQCIIFSIALCTFHPTHVMLIPQAPLFYMCFGTQICVFHEFHAPSTSEMQLLQHPNVFGQKLVRNSRFQQKTCVFLQNGTFCKILFTKSQISRFMCSAVQNM